MKESHKKLLNDLEDLFIPIQELKEKAQKNLEQKPDLLMKVLRTIIN